MAKRVRFYLIFTPIFLSLFLFAFSSEVFAKEDEIQDCDNYTLQNLGSEEANEILGEFMSLLPPDLGAALEEGNLQDAVGPEAILNEIIFEAKGDAGRVGSFFLKALGLALLLSLAHQFPGGGRGSVLTAGLAASVILYRELLPIVNELTESLLSLNRFFAGVSGVLGSLLLASGKVSTASIQAGGMGFTLSLLSVFSTPLMTALASAHFSVGIISSLEGGYTSVAKGIRSAFFFILGIGSTLLVGILALQGFIAGATDTAALRAAKYAASGLIPIVGGTVSGALSTLLSGLSYAGGIIGGGAVACIILMALSPLVLLILYRLSLSLVILFLDFLPDGVGGAFIGLRGAVDALLAVFSLTAVIYVLEILIFIKGGATVF